MKFDCYLTPYTETTSEQIVELNINGGKKIKHSKENVVISHHEPRVGIFKQDTKSTNSKGNIDK